MTPRSRAGTSSATAASASARSRWRRCLRASARGEPTRSRDPFAPKKPHFPGEGEGGHSPVHGRRAEPARPVRLQAGAGEARRQAAAAGGHRGPALRLHPPRRRRCSGRGSSSRSTARAARSSPRCCRTWRRSWTTSAIVKAVHTDQFNHAPAQIFFNTGFAPAGPAEPGLVGRSTASGARRRTCRRSSSCPPARASAAARRTGRAASCRPSTPACASATRATRSSTSPAPPGVDARLQRDTLDLVGELNRQRLGAVGDPEIATRIAAYEMAFRLQTAAPELMDLQEGAEGDARPVRRRPGQAVVRAGVPARPADGRARRAVRQHLPRRLGRPLATSPATSRTTAARPTRRRAALVADLKRRGLLDDTLVIWGGEFGRTPMVEIEPGARPQPRPRPSSAGLHDVDGRRRHQAGRDATARPTTSASTPSRARSTSTTCRRRSCTCSASTTRSSPTATPAATSA